MEKMTKNSMDEYVYYSKVKKGGMKGQLKKLRGTTLKTMVGELCLREYYRLEQSEYDQIYFKCTGMDMSSSGICKLYDLSEQPSRERYHNEMQQYEQRTLPIIYERVHCEEIKVKKCSYGLVLFQRLDKDPSVKECMNSLSGFERMKLTITLIELLINLQQSQRIYCNIRPNNIFKSGDRFLLINAEYLRPRGLRSNMDTFMLETIENGWQYWPAQVTDPYSNQMFDYLVDVYAVGCILYEIIAGKFPFQSKLSAINGHYTKLDSKNLISKIAEAFLSSASQRRQINMKQILSKLRECSNQIKMSESAGQPTPATEQKNRKGSNNGGIFDNISNVFSKMMNDSEGWFLNYVEDSEEAPNEKYLDNILTKMYKKQQKSQKISMIIQKFVSNNQNKINSIRKTILMIGQAIRRGPQTALHSFLPNILSIKSIFASVKEIQTLCSLLQKKCELNQKLKKIMSGNFYIMDVSNFKQLSIQDLASMITYIQKLIEFVEGRSHEDNSQLLQTLVNFACDQIYDLVSTVIFSMLSIRKDNQLQLRHDNIKELQPLEKVMNMCLKKLSNLSNFISAHAIYSLEGEYIPYQQQIMLKSNPYYSTLEYFYNTARSYKGLSVPTDYAALFSSTFHRDEKKSVHSASKEIKNSTIEVGNGKNYFKDEIGSDQDDQLNRSGKIVTEVQTRNIDNISFQIVNKKTSIKEDLDLNVKVNDIKVTFKPPKSGTTNQTDRKDSQGNAKKNTNVNVNIVKVENTISFQQFGDITKIKAPKSPPKDFKEFQFFNDEKKFNDMKKPPLPKTTTKTTVTVNVTNTSFVDFDQIFDKSNSNNKNSLSTSDLKSSKVQPNFDAFSSFLAQPQKRTEVENPLVKKLLQGLKLKQLKDLIQKNRNFVLDFKQLKLMKVIGSGSAGQVYYGKYKQQQVAIKKVKAKQNPNALKQFQRELVTYIKIKKNPHLVSLVGVSADNGDFYLITQFCSSGSLFDLLHKKKLDIVLSWKQRLSFAIEIAEGMEFLHSMKPIIIHRDLKSLNVFVTKNGNNQWKMKVADFGLSRSPEADMMTTQLGTIHWMAPELLEGKQYSYKVDVYSYGVLLWEILSRTTPYSNLQNPMAILKYVVIDKKRPNLENIPKECPGPLISVMEKCWAHEPNDRPPFSEIIKLLKTINV